MSTLGHSLSLRALQFSIGDSHCPSRPQFIYGAVRYNQGKIAHYLTPYLSVDVRHMTPPADIALVAEGAQRRESMTVVCKIMSSYSQTTFNNIQGLFLAGSKEKSRFLV